MVMTFLHWVMKNSGEKKKTEILEYTTFMKSQGKKRQKFCNTLHLRKGK